ncbi:hypothetical protein [Dactylosporangium sp. NPDC050588]|uniref:hypothetical protein n=1 Tax=Dactylosporangium sp. NPDC050588 TaxID=3157211 RepID=UPI0033DAA5A5
MRAALEQLAKIEPRLGGSVATAAFTIRHGIAPNWLGSSGPVSVEAAMLDTASLARIAGKGIAVAWIPRPEILAELISAHETEVFLRVTDREQDILDDCDRVAMEAQRGTVGEQAHLLRQAIAAARQRHYSAAQALATNILDTTLRVACPLGVWQGYRPLREAIEELRRHHTWRRLRTGLALAPLLLALDSFDGAAGAVPGHYNRHATVHAAGTVQYTRQNTITAIMAASSAIREAHAMSIPHAQ